MDLSLNGLPRRTTEEPEDEVDHRFKKVMEKSGLLVFRSFDREHIYKNVTSSQIVQLEKSGSLGNGAFGNVTKVKYLSYVMAEKTMLRNNNDKEIKAILADLGVVHVTNECPYIVNCYGYIITQFHAKIYMETMLICCEKLLEKRGYVGLPEQVIGKIALNVTKGMQFLKARLSLMHRDVKPSNILLGWNGCVKLCDFGISGRLVDSMAVTTSLGAISYLAPERINDTKYGTRADVWSLGISLIQLAEGIFPFKHYGATNSPFEIMAKIGRDPPPQLPTDKGFSLEFCDFVAKCLEKDPQNRPKFHELLELPFLVSAENSDFDMEDFLANQETINQISPQNIKWKAFESDFLGRGSFSNVYKGTFNGKEVALKMPKLMPLTSKENIIKALKKEALIYHQLKHQNIIKFYGICIEEPFCLVLGLCQGKSLFDLLSKMHYSIPIQIIHWALQISKAMDYLHNENLIHANLKSSIVLIKEDPCLCDNENLELESFNSTGLCKICGKTKLNSLTFKLSGLKLCQKQGKPQCGLSRTSLWTAPEIFIGKTSHTKQSDIYSFGVVVWEMITRKRPFENQDYSYILQKIRDKRRLLHIPKDCPSILKNLVKECCTYEFEKRPSFSGIISKLNQKIERFEKYNSNKERIYENDSNSVFTEDSSSSEKDSPSLNSTDLSQFENQPQKSHIEETKEQPAINKNKPIRPHIIQFTNFQQAQIHFDKKEYDLAFSTLQTALLQQPTFIPMLKLRAKIEFKLGKIEDAIGDLKMVLGMDKNDKKARELLDSYESGPSGLCQKEAGNNTKIKKDIKEYENPYYYDDNIKYY